MIDLISQASSLAVAANAAALEKMDWKLKRSDEELDLVNKWLDEVQGKPLSKFIVNTAGHLCSGLYAEHMVFGTAAAATEVESLKAELQKDKAEATE